MKIKNIRINSIKAKLIILILVTLIPLAVLQIIVIDNNYKRSVDKQIMANEDFAEAYSTSLMNYLKDIWRTEYALGLSIVKCPQWDEKNIMQYMTEVKLGDVGISDFLWVSPTGHVISATDSSYKGADLARMDYIKQIISGKENVVSDLLPNSDENIVFVAVAREIRINNRLAGIVVGIVQEKQIQSFFSIKRDGATSSYGLVDKNGMIVYRFNTPNLLFDNRRIKADSPTWKALQGQIVRVSQYNNSVDGSARLGINYPIKSIGWACFVSDPVSEQLKPYIFQMRNSIISLIIVFLISLIIATGIGARFIVSFNRILKTTKEVISGNLTARTNLKGNDEIAVISQALDNMTEKVDMQVKRIEEYSNLRAQFLTTMSHELKTPLNIILGCVQLIEKLNSDDKESYINSIKKYNKMQKQNSYRLLRLINNLIDINKIESNSIEVYLLNGNIVETVENITLSVSEFANLKNINLIFDTEVEEKIIAFDPDKVERIILNLLSNAIKFTEPGGTIEVNIYDRGEKVVITVKDNGMGIPSDKYNAIFDRFVQLDTSFTRKSEGSGIGLSLVKFLVEKHDGKISVQSELGKGSEFIIEFPVRLTSASNTVDNKINIAGVERFKIEFSDIYM
jgi:signal transduction histidine kinase